MSVRSAARANLQQNLAGAPGLVGSPHGVLNLLQRVRRLYWRGKDSGAHEPLYSPEKLEHPEDALCFDPLGQPETFDAFLPDHEQARVERDRLAGERAVDEHAASLAKAADGGKAHVAADGINSERD